ncbi:MAG: insulinase family protein [Lachnospiraceae bacterium]|nr:insulinase family protein [Lachnospiraceae bacterium]
MIKTFKDIHEAYRLEKEEYLEDLRSMGGVLRHKKSGARVVLLSNDDDNKVFSVAFRTTPTDSTGVAHIMEHSVLCGSERFPLKDPFVELVKGSLNTFLNAITFPDKTMYPVASCNEKDFKNLVHVYLDAVFRPNIYVRPEIFKQEGWHYEMEDADSELTINGVVYNEMKGAYSNPEEILYSAITKNAYPDTTYGMDSGGDPEFIPTLTYEAFLDFHRKYYHPSNSYIYIYGDADMRDQLDFIDREYLSNYGSDPVDSAIGLQAPFDAMKDISLEYPVNTEEDEKDGGYFSYSVVIDKTFDPEEYVGLQILQYALMDSPGAPLKRALIDAGIGKNVYGSMESSMRQPLFSIIAGNADVKDKDRFYGIIKETLIRLREEGLNRRTIEGALNAQEFSYRESDFGMYPKGLMVSLGMFDSWLYNDDEPFVFLKLGDIFDRLRAKAEEGYFEELMERIITDNPHALLLTMIPKAGLSAVKEEETKKKLAAVRAAMTPEEIDDIVKETKALKEYQEAPDSPEALETLPLLDIEDIKKTSQAPVNEYREINGAGYLLHDAPTNGIVYQNLLFDISDISYEELPYVPMLVTFLSKMDTKKRSYSELSDELTINLGGYSSQPRVFSRYDGSNIKIYFSVSSKVLKAKMGKARELITEILTETDFSDENRLKELVGTANSRLQPAISSMGSRIAAVRAGSYLSEEAFINDCFTGIGLFLFVKELDRSSDERVSDLRKRMEELTSRFFVKERLMTDITCSKELTDEAIKEAELLRDALPSGKKAGERKSVFKPELKNEAFIIPGNVQFNAVAGNFAKAGLEYDGAMRVLEVLMRYDYLWTNIRVKGGAYGCSSSYRIDGSGTFTSYRDPNLRDTYEVFNEAGSYIRELELSDRDLHKYMIGAISDLDIPLTPSGLGSFSMGCWLTGVDEALLNNRRAQLLSTTKEKLRSFAEHLDAVCSSGARCTIGSESAIEKDRDLFNETVRI